MKQVAFLGAGNMGGALARAACRAVGGDQVVISDPNAAKAAALAQSLGCTAAAGNEAAAAAARYVFFCVKPQVLRGVLEELVPALNRCHEAGEDKVLVSIAAGIQTQTIRGWLAGLAYPAPVLRVMPNTCVEIGRGMLALAAAPGTAEEYLAGVEEILAQAGRVERLEERLMDAFTAVAGCGPAYVYQMIEALADGGVLVGLPRAQAQVYAAQTVLGAAAMVLESGRHPGALKDAVCSPGGSTIAGVAELEACGFRSAGIRAVAAAFQRNADLGKG